MLFIFDIIYSISNCITEYIAGFHVCEGPNLIENKIEVVVAFCETFILGSSCVKALHDLWNTTIKFHYLRLCKSLVCEIVNTKKVEYKRICRILGTSVSIMMERGAMS